MDFRLLPPQRHGKQALYDETANEIKEFLIKNILTKAGWKNDVMKKNTPILPRRIGGNLVKMRTGGGLARPRAWLVAQCQAAFSSPGHVDFCFVR